MNTAIRLTIISVFMNLPTIANAGQIFDLNDVPDFDSMCPDWAIGHPDQAVGCKIESVERSDGETEHGDASNSSGPLFGCQEEGDEIKSFEWTRSAGTEDDVGFTNCLGAEYNHYFGEYFPEMTITEARWKCEDVGGVLKKTIVERSKVIDTATVHESGPLTQECTKDDGSVVTESIPTYEFKSKCYHYNYPSQEYLDCASWRNSKTKTTDPEATWWMFRDYSESVSIELLSEIEGEIGSGDEPIEGEGEGGSGDEPIEGEGGSDDDTYDDGYDY